MAIEHNVIPNAELHEVKGASAAGATEILVADGAGAATFQITNPHGNFHYTNLASAATMSVTTSYSVINDAAISETFATDEVSAMAHSGGRLTYTGTPNRHFHIVTNWSIDHSTGTSRDLSFAIYRNGAIIDHAESIQTTSSGTKVEGSLHADILCSTSDYFELYVKGSASLTLNIYAMYMFTVGMV